MNAIIICAKKVNAFLKLEAKRVGESSCFRCVQPLIDWREKRD